MSYVRTENVKIRLSKEVKDLFQEQAQKRGMTLSGLGAWVIGEWVRQQLVNEAIRDQALREMMEKITPYLEEIVDDPGQ